MTTKFSIKTVPFCCDLEILSRSLKVVWTGKVQQYHHAQFDIYYIYGTSENCNAVFSTHQKPSKPSIWPNTDQYIDWHFVMPVKNGPLAWHGSLNTLFYVGQKWSWMKWKRRIPGSGWSMCSYILTHSRLKRRDPILGSNQRVLHSSNSSTPTQDR